MISVVVRDRIVSIGGVKVTGAGDEIVLWVITRGHDVNVGVVGANITSGGGGVVSGDANIIAGGVSGVDDDNIVSGIGVIGGVNIVAGEAGVDTGAKTITNIVVGVGVNVVPDRVGIEVDDGSANVITGSGGGVAIMSVLVLTWLRVVVVLRLKMVVLT